MPRKAARLRYLRLRWAERLKTQPRFRIHTSFDPAQSGAIGTVGVEGLAPGGDRDDAVGHGADHRHADRPRRIPGRPRDPEPLHDARRSRHLRRRDGAAQAGRSAGASRPAERLPQTRASLPCGRKSAYRRLPASVNAQFTVRRISMRRTFLYGLMTALLVAGATTAPPRAGRQADVLVAVLHGGSEAPTVVNTGRARQGDHHDRPGRRRGHLGHRRLQLPTRPHRVAHPRRRGRARPARSSSTSRRADSASRARSG